MKGKPHQVRLAPSGQQQLSHQIHGVLGQNGLLRQHVRHDEQVEDEEHGQEVHDRQGRLET